MYHLPFSIPSDMWQYVYPIWHEKRLRQIDISKVGQALGEETCKNLQELHAFTDCDSVSAYCSRINVSALKLVMMECRLQKAMERLGKALVLSKELFTLLQEFVCKM